MPNRNRVEAVMDKYDINTLSKIFYEQFPDIHLGGFYNPRLLYDDGKHLEFRCNYDGYSTEDGKDGEPEDEDAWHWCFDKQTNEFWT